MKRLLIVLLLLLLIGCSKSVNAITDYEALDNIIEQKMHGAFTEAVAYDLREGALCDQGYINGFMCIFYYQHVTIESLFDHVVSYYSKKATIILICEDGLVSSDFANRLHEAGYQRVYFFVGGYTEYVEQNKDFIPMVGCPC